MSFLTTELLQLVFDQLSYADQLAFRDTTPAVRLAYRRYVEHEAIRVQDLPWYSDLSLAELTQFLEESQLSFSPDQSYRDRRINRLTASFFKQNPQLLSAKAKVSYSAVVEQIISDQEAACLIPLPLHSISYMSEKLFLRTRNRELLVDGRLVMSDVNWFQPIDSESWLAYKDDQLFCHHGVLGEYGTITSGTLVSNLFILSEGGQLSRINTKQKCIVPVVGWFFLPSPISLAYGQTDGRSTLMIINSHYQAHLVTISDDVISTINGVTERAQTVLSLGNHFLLLMLDGELLLVTVKSITPLSFSKRFILEGAYRSIRKLGTRTDSEGIKHHDFLLQDDNDGVQLHITEQPWSVSVTRLDKRWGYFLTLERGTYSLDG